MPFNVPEDKKTEFNKTSQAALKSLMSQINESALELVSAEQVEPEAQSIMDQGGNIISNPLDIFSTPLNKSKTKVIGLTDANGNVTDRGKLFYNLKEAGMFDDNGVITPEGKAYLMNPNDLGKPENIDAYEIHRKDGLLRQDATFGEMRDNLWNLGRDAVYGLLQTGGTAAERYYSETVGGGISPELEAKTTALNIAFDDQKYKNILTLARMADIAMNWMIEGDNQIRDYEEWGKDVEVVKKDSKDLLLAQQRQYETNRIISNAAAGEITQYMDKTSNAVKEAEDAIAVIGKEAFDRFYKQSSASTEIFTSPDNLITGIIPFKAARTASIAGRIELTAQNKISQLFANKANIAATQASLQAAKDATSRGEILLNVTKRFTDRAAEVGASPVAIERGRQASEIAARTARITEEAVASIPELTARLDELTKKGNLLSTRIPVAAAEATVKAMQVGRNLRAMPANAVGSVLEGFGNTLTKVDNAVSGFLKERGLDQMYTAALGAGGVLGLAGSPVVGAIAGGAAALKAGKAIANYGKLFKYVGAEMVKAKGQIPFWQRVAAHTAPGSLNRGIAHAFNMLDLSGVTSDTLRRIPVGVAAAYPTDLMFEWLSDGGEMRPQTFLQAGAESLFIGGSFAAAGGAFMGTKKRMRELSIGDQVNFLQNMTDDRQKALYNVLPKGVRSAVATYAIANPTLIYEFKESGDSEYDPNSNTATINVRSTNPIRPLIAHETLHHTIVKNNMEGGIAVLFLGDTIENTTGGLLRSRDGKLDPNFEAFRDRYYQRLNIAGMTDAEKNAIYPLEKVAVEYFIEQHSDQYAAMAESGELGAIAASSDIKRKLSGVLETVLPRIPVLRDLHFKSGGMIDKDGGWVTGNGILDAEGVKTNPITSKMFRDMNKRSSGLAPGQFEPLFSDKEDSGAQIRLDPTNAIDVELMHPLVKVDDNNETILVNGQPVALDKATLLERALAGLTAKEVLRRKKAENYIPEKGEAYIDDLGEYNPGWLSNDVLAEMFAKNRFNPEQKRIIREMNRMIRKGDGGRAVMINFPATTRNKSGKAVYKPQGATLRDTVPVAITISKDGNLLFGIMSVNKLQENIKKRSQSRLGKKLYGGNVDLILRDTQAMMQFHKDGVDSIEYFKSKYGAVEADERKKFINTMFGLLNQREQAVLNPMLIEDGVKSKDNVYRTYRADRVSKAVAMSPDDYPAMPFNYEAVSQVKMPEQARQMPENISPEDLNPVANRVEAQRLFADSKRMFAVNEMDGVVTEITSLDMLNSYPPDAIGYIDSADQSDIRYMPEGVDEDGFYSQLNKVITDKIPTRATASQIMATIDPTRGSGVKAEEIKWSGIEQALKSLEKDGKVSKEDLLNYLRNEGRVRFEEVTNSRENNAYTMNGEVFTSEAEAKTKRDELVGDDVANIDQQSYGFGWDDATQQWYADDDTIAAINGEYDPRESESGREFFTNDEVFKSIFGKSPEKSYPIEEGDFEDTTKFAQYTLPGGENYREVVLAMPNPPTKRTKFGVEIDMEGWGKNNRYKLGVEFDNEQNAQKFIDQKYAESGNPKVISWDYEEKTPAEYTSSHFPDIPNYVAHMRVNERTDGNGNPGLFVEEFQSDRHQAGRKQGYKGNSSAVKEQREDGTWHVELEDGDMKNFYTERDADRYIEDSSFKKIPDAPFRTTWPLALFKRALRDAVDSKKEWIGWTVGETQNDRFDLSKSVDKIAVHGRTDAYTGEKTRSVFILMPVGDGLVTLGVNNDGIVNNTDTDHSQFNGKRLDDIVGKDMSQKIMGAKSGTIFEGEGLKMGGSGMKGFYDTMLPKEIGKYVKQWGGKVEKSEILTKNEMGTPKYEPIWRVDITPEMQKLGQTGQLRFMPERNNDIPKSEGGSLKPSTWDSLAKVGYNPSASEKTQIPTTTPTYEKIVNANAKKGMKVLDFSAGRGIGTASMKRIGKDKGFDVSGYEPYSNPNTRVIAPEYEGIESLDKIPDNSYDLIINNAVLNVVPEDIGRDIVNDIYNKLAPEGSAFINVMGWNNIKGRLKNPKTKLVGPREVVTQKGTFQKGYTPQTLRSLIESELPEAKVVRTNYGDIGFKVTKPKNKIGQDSMDAGAGVETIKESDANTEQGTPAPDSDVQLIPLTGNPIPWDQNISRQVRFMPESNRNAFPTMSPKLLAEIEKETSTLAAIHIDRMRVGEYMGIDLQGGMFYPTIKENLKEGVVWAFNSTGVARTVANRAAQNKGYVKLVLMQEGNVVGNKTFTNIWFKVLSDSIDKKKISKDLALSELNFARKVVYNKIKSKDIKRNPWVSRHASDWESLDEARESILSMPQIERGGSYFKKSKTQTKAEGEKMAYQALLSQKMTKLGFPDARKIVSDIEEPAFKGIPTGAAVAIIKFNPLAADEKVMTAKEAGVPEHMSYGWVLKGKPVAKIGYYQVIDETFPTTKGQIMTQQNTNFPVRASIPSKKSARGEIKYNQATQLSIANAAKMK